MLGELVNFDGYKLGIVGVFINVLPLFMRARTLTKLHAHIRHFISFLLIPVYVNLIATLSHAIIFEFPCVVIYMIRSMINSILCLI